VATTASSNRPVRLALPGGHEAGFAKSLRHASGFDVKPLPDGRVEIAPAEGSGTVPQYFTPHRLADANTDLGASRTWQPVFEHPPHSDKPAVELGPEMQKHFSELYKRTDLPAVIERLSVSAALAPTDELPAVLGRELGALFARYPGGSLWYIAVQPLLMKRLAFTRVLLQTSLTPDINYGREKRDGVPYFGMHTTTSGVAFDEPFAHILLTIPPTAMGFHFGVYPHAFVFLFGEPEDLRLRRDKPLAAAFYPRVNPTKSTPGIKFPHEELPVSHVESLLQWWATRLNIVYGYAADPTNFAAGAEHDVVSQQAWFFTLERMMADAAVMLAAVDAPPLLRMQAAFDMLDKADSLLTPPRKDTDGKNFKRLLRRTEVLPRLERAFRNLPLQLQGRYVQWARESFDRFYDDIKQSTMAKRREKKGVRVAFTDPAKPQLMPWDDYIPELMRTARNSSHGLQRILRPPTATKSQKRDPRLLLATNAGEVPNSFYEVTAVLFFGLMADAARLCDRSWWTAGG
jgi:hypothetical protein